jgi:hypothetical protein
MASAVAASSTTSVVSMVRRPPFGMASRALTARLVTTCSSWPASTRTEARPARGEMVSLMSSPITRRSIGSTFCRPRLTFITFGCCDSRRLNASICRVSSAARMAARLICSASARFGSRGSMPVSTISV